MYKRQPIIIVKITIPKQYATTPATLPPPPTILPANSPIIFPTPAAVNTIPRAPKSCGNKLDAPTVSYTHLDVYKRQVIFRILLIRVYL